MSDGQLHEISVAIGSLRTKVDMMNDDIKENRSLADDRHTENKDKLKTIEETLRSLVNDRNKLVVAIGAIVAFIYWVVPHAITYAMAKLGWK